MEYLLYARQFIKCVLHIAPLNHHHYPISQVLLHSHPAEEKIVELSNWPRFTYNQDLIPSSSTSSLFNAEQLPFILDGTLEAVSHSS